jgi:hypothetical protein
MTLDALQDDNDSLLSARFSGHESFALRYAWLPKAYKGLKANPELFADEDQAMAVLGIGKNMVRSLRFWVEATGLIEPSKPKVRELTISPFGERVFGPGGLDPFIEDERTLWLLHWALGRRQPRPLFAWEYLLSRWPLPEFSRSEALAAFQRESRALGFSHSDVTLGQHLDVFLHTYLPGRGGEGAEDSLDGPLVDLGLLAPVGDRRNAAGRIEPVYAFRRDSKPEITPALFDYCLMQFWAPETRTDATLSLRQATLGPGSPGQIFKLTEADVRSRLEDHAAAGYDRPYTYQASAVQGMLVHRRGVPTPGLEAVFA